MKIVFLDAATIGKDVSLLPIEKQGQLICYDFTLPQQRAERVKEADVVIVNKVIMDKQTIDSAPYLKMICVAATGTNNVDSVYANSKGIPVKNAVAYSTESVVQITFTHILALLSSSHYFDNYVKCGDYSRGLYFTNTERTFTEMKGKNFGVIGLGTIGKRVAAIASLFGANVSYYSTNGIAHDKSYPSVSLDELLAKSDIISIHAPLNEKTKDLIKLNELKKMKTTAIIVNMGRGGIINEQDLAKALDYDLISGAALDVFVQEPLPESHPFLKIINKEKLLLTPHIGWASKEARILLVEKIAENIKSL